MLSYYWYKIIFFGLVTSNTNDEVARQIEVELHPIILIFILAIVILFVFMKYTNTLKRFPNTIIFFKTFFKSIGKDKEAIDEVIDASGYEYDSKQDIFYSKMNAWQREHGYCRLYDESAAPLGLIMDCEPIYFEYGGKRWLIEFWKGQYGMTTGGEIGVYTTEGPDLNIPGVFNGTFYNCASNADRLRMSYSLKKNGRTLFKRKGKHWWLTGFKLGEFSEPSSLTMELNIILKNEIMRNEFVKGLKNANYSNREIKQNGNTISLTFSKPHVPQPFTRNEKTDWIVQRKNQLLCEEYQYITRDYKSTPDKINAIREKAPELYEEILNIGKTKKIFNMYKLIKN